MAASLKTTEIEIALAIRKALESKELDAGSAMRIVRKGMELLNAYPGLRGAEKKMVLVRVLEQVSAGNDGVLGTDDDLLPEATLKAMKALLEGDLIGDIVDTFVALTKGDLSAVDAGKVASIFARLKDVFTGLMACVSSMKKKPAEQVKPAQQAKPAKPILSRMERPLPAMITNPVAVAPAAAPAPVPKNDTTGVIDRLDKRIEPTQVLYSCNIDAA